MILQNCKDIIEDPVAGTCYCINVGEKSDFQGKREEHKDMLTNGGSSGGNAAAQKKKSDGEAAAEARKQQKNKILGKQIINKLKGATYDVMNVMKRKEFTSIDKATQKSITDKKKMLTTNEKKALDAIERGADIDCTLEQVGTTVKEVAGFVALVDKWSYIRAQVANMD